MASTNSQSNDVIAVNSDVEQLHQLAESDSNTLPIAEISVHDFLSEVLLTFQNIASALSSPLPNTLARSRLDALQYELATASESECLSMSIMADSQHAKRLVTRLNGAPLGAQKQLEILRLFGVPPLLNAQLIKKVNVLLSATKSNYAFCLDKPNAPFSNDMLIARTQFVALGLTLGINLLIFDYIGFQALHFQFNPSAQYMAFTFDEFQGTLTVSATPTIGICTSVKLMITAFPIQNLVQYYVSRHLMIRTFFDANTCNESILLRTFLLTSHDACALTFPLSRLGFKRAPRSSDLGYVNKSNLRLNPPLPAFTYTERTGSHAEHAENAQFHASLRAGWQWAVRIIASNIITNGHVKGRPLGVDDVCYSSHVNTLVPSLSHILSDSSDRPITNVRLSLLKKFCRTRSLSSVLNSGFFSRVDLYHLLLSSEAPYVSKVPDNYYTLHAIPGLTDVAFSNASTAKLCYGLFIPIAIPTIPGWGMPVIIKIVAWDNGLVLHLGLILGPRMYYGIMLCEYSILLPHARPILWYCLLRPSDDSTSNTDTYLPSRIISGSSFTAYDQLLALSFDDEVFYAIPKLDLEARRIALGLGITRLILNTHGDSVSSSNYESTQKLFSAFSMNGIILYNLHRAAEMRRADAPQLPTISSLLPIAVRRRENLSEASFTSALQLYTFLHTKAFSVKCSDFSSLQSFSLRSILSHAKERALVLPCESAVSLSHSVYTHLCSFARCIIQLPHGATGLGHEQHLARLLDHDVTSLTSERQHTHAFALGEFTIQLHIDASTLSGTICPTNNSIAPHPIHDLKLELQFFNAACFECFERHQQINILTDSLYIALCPLHNANHFGTDLG